MERERTACAGRDLNPIFVTFVPPDCQGEDNFFCSFFDFTEKCFRNTAKGLKKDTVLKNVHAGIISLGTEKMKF